MASSSQLQKSSGGEMTVGIHEDDSNQLLMPAGLPINEDHKAFPPNIIVQQPGLEEPKEAATKSIAELRLEQLLRQSSKTSILSTYEMVKDKIHNTVQTRLKQHQQQKSQDLRLRYVTGFLFLAIVLLIGIAFALFYRQKDETQFFDRVIYGEKSRVLRFLDANHEHVIQLSLASSIPHKSQAFDCSKVYYPGQQDTIRCLEWYNEARLIITHFMPSESTQCYNMYWRSLSNNISPKDCFTNGIEYVVPSSDPYIQTQVEAKYPKQGQWFGGGESLQAAWPLQKGHIKLSAFVTGDEGQTEWGNAIRKYFVNSRGVSLTIDDETPLFVSVNDFPHTGLCMEARYDDFAYFYHRFTLPRLNYTVCTSDNIKKLHYEQLPKSFWEGHKQTDLDTLHHLLKTPIWQVPPNQAESFESLEAYVKMLVQDYNATSSDSPDPFPNGYLLLDYHWQQHLGDFKFKQQFPDIAKTVQMVKDHGLKLVLTVSPFICTDSLNFLPVLEQNLFISQRNASANVPALTWFKDVVSAGMIDITNNRTEQWLRTNLRNLLQQLRGGRPTNKLDFPQATDDPQQPDVSFFLETGNAFHTPSYFKFEVPLSNPDLFRDLFVHDVMEEVPVIGVSGATSKRPKAPAFVFLSPLEPKWSHLQSIIPNVLQLSIIGYPFVNPGPVGGVPVNLNNQTNAEPTDEELELYIRWWQLNTFLPMLHFLRLPSDFNNTLVSGIQKSLSHIRQRLVLPELIRFANEAMHSSAPIIRPLWMMDPTDEVTHTINDQFMIGDTILVAPVLKLGQRSRDVYLPQDENASSDNTVIWKRGSDGTFFKGGRWIHDTRVNLNEVVYFVKQNADSLPGLG